MMLTYLFILFLNAITDKTDASLTFNNGYMQYWGCFKDNVNDRDLPHEVSLNAATIDWCVDQCLHLGYQYAGYQNSEQCFCGDSYGRHGKIKNGCSNKCQMLDRPCGGVNENAIYSTGADQGLDDDIKYMGCFIDTYERDLPALKGYRLDELSIEWCVDQCRKSGYQYAGLQTGDQCFCGQSYGRHGKKTNGCGYRCNGSGKLECGGGWENAVYSTGARQISHGILSLWKNPNLVWWVKSAKNNKLTVTDISKSGFWTLSFVWRIHSPGLTGQIGTVSFEHSILPHHYIVADKRGGLVVEPYEESFSYKVNAAFHKKNNPFEKSKYEGCFGFKGLCGRSPEYISFSKKGFKMKGKKNDAALFNIDTLKVQIVVDNQYELYIDGTMVGSGNNLLQMDSYPVNSHDQKALAIKGIDTGGPGNIIAGTNWGGWITDNSDWKCTSVNHPGWEAVGFDDSDWPAAVESANFTRQDYPRGWIDDNAIDPRAKAIWTIEQYSDKEIYCRLEPKGQELKLCEGLTESLSCIRKSVLILRAKYGNTEAGICSNQPNANCFKDVTTRVKQICDGEPSCDVTVNNSEMGGDPCPNKAKYLQVIYTCQ